MSKFIEIYTESTDTLYLNVSHICYYHLPAGTKNVYVYLSNGQHFVCKHYSSVEAFKKLLDNL